MADRRTEIQHAFPIGSIVVLADPSGMAEHVEAADGEGDIYQDAIGIVGGYTAGADGLGWVYVELIVRQVPLVVSSETAIVAAEALRPATKDEWMALYIRAPGARIRGMGERDG